MTGGPGAERAQGQDVLAGLGELERRALLAWIGENLQAPAGSHQASGDDEAPTAT
jgi:hypothetical protein